MYIHQIVYNNKLEHKYTLIPLVPRLLYEGLYMPRETCPLGTPVQIRVATCLYYVYNVQLHVQLHVQLLSVLCSIRQLPMRTMQCQAASNEHYADFCAEYIIFILFCDHIYQNYTVSRHIQAIRQIFLTFYTLKFKIP